MGVSYQKWVETYIDELHELYDVFLRHFPEYKDNKTIYRDFCILIYSKSNEQSKGRRW